MLTHFYRPITFVIALLVLTVGYTTAQESVFKSPARGWDVAGDVNLLWSKQTKLELAPGEGVWVSIPQRKGGVDDLTSAMDYADVEVELSYLLATGTEATLYLGGIYPFVLSDSRGIDVPTAQSNGGIGGYAPRQEVGRAPGLWQRLKIKFRASQFDAGGVRVAPATLVSAQLNGVMIHENVQLLAPEGVSEKPKASVRIKPLNGSIAVKDVHMLPLADDQSDRERNSPDPILINADVNTTLRSFMDVPGSPRVVHAISVGHPQHVHYTYDLDKGKVIQVWRGGFLDATPMWHDRGNGTSRVLGSPIYFDQPGLTIGKLASQTDAWPTDTTGTGYKPKGYRMDAQELPIFRYQLYGGAVEDSVRPLSGGEGFTRTISFRGAPEGAYLRLAAASSIVDQGKGVYLIGDKAWYLKLEESGNAKPIIRDQPTGKELLLPIRSNIRYSIIF